MTPETDRLTDLLTRAAAAVEVQPDLDAVVADADGPSPVVRLDEAPRRTRRRLALAGVAAVALVAVGIVVAGSRTEDRSTETAGAPAGEAVYPVVDLPAEVADRPFAAVVTEVRAEPDVLAAPLSGAVLGTEGPDGSLTDLVEVEVGAPGGRSIDDAGELGLEVAGHDASMTSDGRTVYVDGDPRVVFRGAEEVASRVRGLARVDASWTDGVAGLALTLPRPTTSILALAPVPDEPVPTLDAFASGADADTGPRVTVRTRTDDPIAELAFAGGMEPVDVGGSPGYQVLAVDGGLVAWTTPEGVNAVVEVRGLGPDTDLEVARSLRLVDQGTWLATYPDGPAVTETLPPVTEAQVPDVEALPPTTQAQGPDAEPTTTTSEAAPATTGARTGTEADIEAAFRTAFDADLSEEERFAAVEDGPALVEAGREAVARFPAATASISVTVHDVDVVAADRATVVFELLYDDAQPLGRQTGGAVLVDGAWKVTRETRCAIIRQAGVACP